VHFLRNALDHVPRRVDDDCLQELRWLYDRRDLIEARRDLALRTDAQNPPHAWTLTVPAASIDVAVYHSLV
jgi:transposase-like protein